MSRKKSQKSFKKLKNRKNCNYGGLPAKTHFALYYLTLEKYSWTSIKHETSVSISLSDLWGHRGWPQGPQTIMTSNINEDRQKFDFKKYRLRLLDVKCCSSRIRRRILSHLVSWVELAFIKMLNSVTNLTTQVKNIRFSWLANFS